MGGPGDGPEVRVRVHLPAEGGAQERCDGDGDGGGGGARCLGGSRSEEAEAARGGSRAAAAEDDLLFPALFSPLSFSARMSLYVLFLHFTRLIIERREAGVMSPPLQRRRPRRRRRRGTLSRGSSSRALLLRVLFPSSSSSPPSPPPPFQPIFFSMSRVSQCTQLSLRLPSSGKFNVPYLSFIPHIQ